MWEYEISYIDLINMRRNSLFLTLNGLERDVNGLDQNLGNGLETIKITMKKLEKWRLMHASNRNFFVAFMAISLLSLAGPGKFLFVF